MKVNARRVDTCTCGCGSVSPFVRGVRESGRRDLKSARLAFRNRVRTVCDSGVLPGCVPRVFCVHEACAQELVKLQVVRL